MPVIDDAGGPQINAVRASISIPTEAVMLYPRDEKRRRLWQAAAMAREYAACRAVGASEETLRRFHTCIADLWEMQLSPARVYTDGQDRGERAALSGVVLLYLLRLDRYNPRHCKLERVKTLLVEFPMPGGRAPSGSLMEKSWAEFKNVSHFWASALRHTAPESDLPPLEWIAFLKRAEGLRRAAEEARLLNPSETWTHAADVIFRSEAELEPLEPAKIAFLDSTFPT